MKFNRTALLHQRRIDTPLGPVLLARTSAGLAGLWFEGQRHSPDSAGWATQEDDALLHEAECQVLDYFADRRAGFDLPLDLSHGTAFQQAVWQALRGITRGQTVRYGALAAQIGLPSAARAVGAAVGRNPLSVIVPCHRVIGSDGSLTGYAGGLARKLRLLTLEGVEGLDDPTSHEPGLDTLPAGRTPKAAVRARDATAPSTISPARRPDARPQKAGARP